MVYVMSYKQSALNLKYVYRLYTSCEVKKPGGISSAKWKTSGTPSVSVAFVRLQRLHECFRLIVCMTGSIRLDQVSSV